MFSISSIVFSLFRFPSLMKSILIIYSSWKISYFTHLFKFSSTEFFAKHIFFQFLLDQWYFLLFVSNVVLLS